MHIHIHSCEEHIYVHIYAPIFFSKVDSLNMNGKQKLENITKTFHSTTVSCSTAESIISLLNPYIFYVDTNT